MGDHRETRGEIGYIVLSYVTSALHTTRFSNVESVLCGDRVRKMVNFSRARRTKLRDSKASTECNFEVGENEYGVFKTRDGQTSVTYGQNW